MLPAAHRPPALKQTQKAQAGNHPNTSSPLFEGRRIAQYILDNQKTDAPPLSRSMMVAPMSSAYASEAVGAKGWLDRLKRPDTPTYQPFIDKGYSILKKHYLKTRLKQSPVGRMLGYRIDPKEEAKNLSETIWQQVCMPLVKDAERGKEIVGQWEHSIQAQYGEHMVRYAALMGLTHLKKELASPEKIKKAVYLVALVMTHGGYEKLEKLLNLSQSDAFKQANRLKQQQMLLEGLGAVFVKAFQTASTLPGLFPPYIQETMEKLYEDLSPIPSEQVKGIIEKELGHPIEKVYHTFDMNPLKVGSIAQVHLATMSPTEDVVVKIVKPGVEESMDSDLALLQPLVDLAQEIIPHFEIQDLFRDFAGKLKNETNMAKILASEPIGESDRLKEMKKALEGAKNVTVPKVYDQHTTKKILTMEKINGQGLLKFRNNPDVASGYLMLLLDMIFTYGYCQADPHPGNILFNPFTNMYGCIDAGLAYEVPVQERVDFAKTLIAIFAKDRALISEAILQPGMEQHEQYKAFQDKLTANFPNLDSLDYKTTLKFLNDSAKLAHQMGLQTKEINPLLWKTLFTAVAVAKTLDKKVGLGYPAVTRLAYLFLKERDANFAMSAVYKVARSQVGKGWENVTTSVSQGWTSVTDRVKNNLPSWMQWGTDSKPDPKPSDKDLNKDPKK
jgi:predicted unusual protein kinase regulating ubiquinone biosynthesis (AarF/ABC1/UbiB family)